MKSESYCQRGKKRPSDSIEVLLNVSTIMFGKFLSPSCRLAGIPRHPIKVMELVWDFYKELFNVKVLSHISEVTAWSSWQPSFSSGALKADWLIS